MVGVSVGTSDGMLVGLFVGKLDGVDEGAYDIDGADVKVGRTVGGSEGIFVG